MSALIVDRRNAEITLRGSMLFVTAGTERMSVPCARIERLIVRQPARIDTAVLARLWAQGAGVLILSEDCCRAEARYLGMRHMDVRRCLGQARLQVPGAAALEIAAAIVRRRMEAESAALLGIAGGRAGLAHGVLAWHERAVDLRARLRQAGSLHTVRGVKGASADAYFAVLQQAFAGLPDFEGAGARPLPAPVSLCLSLGDTLLAFEAARRVQGAGLDPMLGVLNAPVRGREPLACDLIESLRPRLDLMVFECFAEGILRAEHFRCDADGRCLPDRTGRRVFYETVEERMPLWSRWLRRAVRVFVRSLPAGAEEDDVSFGRAVNPMGHTLH